jgi:hypothetical protein
MGIMVRAALFPAVLVVAACCATPPPVACAPGQSLATVSQLYFGRSIPGGGEVSEADWAGFLADEATLRLPEGFTVVDGLGQYRAADGTIVLEPSKVLIVAAIDADAARPAVEALRAAYQVRFRQESVMLVEQPACVAF